jgi:hypothetical protein
LDWAKATEQIPPEVQRGYAVTIRWSCQVFDECDLQVINQKQRTNERERRRYMYQTKHSSTKDYSEAAHAKHQKRTYDPEVMTASSAFYENALSSKAASRKPVCK